MIRSLQRSKTKLRKKMIKLTQEQVATLPELLKTKTRVEVAREWKVRPQNITYWVKQYEKRGVEMPRIKKESTIDKILKQNDTSIYLS